MLFNASHFVSGMEDHFCVKNCRKRVEDEGSAVKELMNIFLRNRWIGLYHVQMF